MTTNPTVYYKLSRPNFNADAWHDDVNDNFTVIDSLLRSVGVVATQGIWSPDTEFVAGNRVVDEADGRIWLALVDHTSGSGTFAEDRADHPEYWEVVDTGLVVKQQFATGTEYFLGDFVYDEAEYLGGMVSTEFVGGANLRANIDDILIIYDLKDTLTNVAPATVASDADMLALTSNTKVVTPAKLKVGMDDYAPSLPMPNPLAPAYLMTLSDILNFQPVDILRFVDRAQHEAIQDYTSTFDMITAFDDAADAFENRGGGKLYVSAGLYNFDAVSPNFAVGNLEIYGDGPGRTILNQLGVGAQSGLQVLKTTTTSDFTSLTYYNISASLARGDMSCTLSTPSEAGNFAAGDLAWIRCRELISSGTNEPVAELVQIKSSNIGTGVVTFAFPLKKPYSIDTTGTIYTFGLAKATGNGEPLENISIHDMTIRNVGGGYPLWVRHGKGIRVHDVQTIGRIGPVFSAGATELDFYSNQVQMINEYPDFPYFIALDKGAATARIHNNQFMSDGAGSVHLHEGVADVSAYSNLLMCGKTTPVAHTVDWPVFSIAASSWDIRVEDNLLINSPFSGIRASNSYKYGGAPYSEPQHVGLVIARNKLYGEFGLDAIIATAGDWGITLDGQVTDYVVDGNILDAIFPAGGGAIRASGVGRVTNNRYRGDLSVGNTAGIVRLGNKPITETDYNDWISLIGAGGATGWMFEALISGQTSPRLMMGNRADGQYTAIYSNGTVIDFTTGCTPGVATGTTRMRVASTGVNVPFAGGAYFANSTKVLGERKTGWTPATGTAARATFATHTANYVASYTAPDISNPPTEAEVQAIADVVQNLDTKMAAVDTHVQVLSQHLKALIDDLHNTAGHGLIGT